MRKWSPTWTAGGLALAMVLVGRQAEAQYPQGGRGGGRGGMMPPPSQTTPPTPQAPVVPGSGGGTVTGNTGKYHIQPLNLHREALGTEGFAQAARARMRSGDCAGALDAFDQALMVSTDPTLNRDRGLCHERLGQPYPAMEDYRIYVTAEPDAADADGIRQRLARLEMDVYHHSSGPLEGDEGGGGGSDTKGTVVVTPGVTTGEAPPRRDAMETVEHDHDDVTSSIRAGKGFGLAPFFSEHKLLLPGSNFGDSTTWSESVGLQLRYSISAQSAFFIEGGWQLFNSTSAATISGLTSQIAYELRVPLDPAYNNQLLLGLGLGYEYLVDTPTNASLSSVSVGWFMPRARVGWRHMITASVGLDLALDLGVSNTKLATTSQFLSNGGDSETFEMLAANLGVVWGL